MPDEDIRIAENAAAKLSEHFDSVVIIVTKREPGGCTSLTHAGRGNWYAREGSVRGWLINQDERSKQSIRREDD